MVRVCRSVVAISVVAISVVAISVVAISVVAISVASIQMVMRGAVKREVTASPKGTSCDIGCQAPNIRPMLQRKRS